MPFTVPRESMNKPPPTFEFPGTGPELQIAERKGITQWMSTFIPRDVHVPGATLLRQENATYGQPGLDTRCKIGVIIGMSEKITLHYRHVSPHLGAPDDGMDLDGEDVIKPPPVELLMELVPREGFQTLDRKQGTIFRFRAGIYLHLLSTIDPDIINMYAEFHWHVLMVSNLPPHWRTEAEKKLQHFIDAGGDFGSEDEDDCDADEDEDEDDDGSTEMHAVAMDASQDPEQERKQRRRKLEPSEATIEINAENIKKEWDRARKILHKEQKRYACDRSVMQQWGVNPAQAAKAFWLQLDINVWRHLVARQDLRETPREDTMDGIPAGRLFSLEASQHQARQYGATPECTNDTQYRQRPGVAAIEDIKSGVASFSFCVCRMCWRVYLFTFVFARAGGKWDAVFPFGGALVYKIRDPQHLFDTHLPYGGITATSQESTRRYLRSRPNAEIDGLAVGAGELTEEIDELRLLTEAEKAARGLAGLVANGVAMAGTGANVAMGAFELFRDADRSQMKELKRAVDASVQAWMDASDSKGGQPFDHEEAIRQPNPRHSVVVERTWREMEYNLTLLRMNQVRLMLPTVSNGPNTNDALIAYTRWLGEFLDENATSQINPMCAPRTRHYANLSRFADNIVGQCRLLDTAHNLVGCPLTLMLLVFAAYTVTDPGDIHLNVVLWGKYAQGKSYLMACLLKLLVPGTWEAIASLSAMADRSNALHIRNHKHMMRRYADELPNAIFGVGAATQQGSSGTTVVNTDLVASTKAWLTTQILSHTRCEKDGDGSFYTNTISERADTQWAGGTNAMPDYWDDAMRNRFLVKEFSAEALTRTVLEVECSVVNDEGHMALFKRKVADRFHRQDFLVTQLNLLTRLESFPDVSMLVAKNFIRMVMKRAKEYGVTNADDPRCLERLNILVRMMAKVDAIDVVFNAPTEAQLHSAWDQRDATEECGASVAPGDGAGGCGQKEPPPIDRKEAVRLTCNKWHDKPWDPASLIACFPHMSGTIEMCVLAMTMLDEFAHSHRNIVLQTIDHMFFRTHELDVSARVLQWHRARQRASVNPTPPANVLDATSPINHVAYNGILMTAMAGELRLASEDKSDDEYSGDEDDLNALAFASKPAGTRQGVGANRARVQHVRRSLGPISDAGVMAARKKPRYKQKSLLRQVTGYDEKISLVASSTTYHNAAAAAYSTLDGAIGRMCPTTPLFLSMVERSRSHAIGLSTALGVSGASGYTVEPPEAPPAVGEKRPRDPNDSGPIKTVSQAICTHMSKYASEIGLARLLTKDQISNCLVELSHEMVDGVRGVNESGEEKRSPALVPAFAVEQSCVYVARSLLDSSHRNPMLVAIAHTLHQLRDTTMHTTVGRGSGDSGSGLVYLLGMPWKHDPRVLLVMDPNHLFHDDPIHGTADAIVPASTPSMGSVDHEAGGVHGPLLREKAKCEALLQKISHMKRAKRYRHDDIRKLVNGADVHTMGVIRRNAETRQDARVAGFNAGKETILARCTGQERSDDGLLGFPTSFCEQYKKDVVIVLRRRRANSEVHKEDSRYMVHRYTTLSVL